MSKKLVVAVVGATGNVGHEVLNYLHDRQFPVSKVIALASENSVGKSVSFGNESMPVLDLRHFDFKGVDIAFFCVGSEISRKYAKDAVAKGCTVIDKSSLYRLDKDVPLIVPEANIDKLIEIRGKPSIISNPNCCVIPLVVALNPLHNAAKIKRVVVSTYQSVSGAGKTAMDELYMQTKAKFIFEELKPKMFPTQIAFNLFPHAGEFDQNGSTDEELKVQEEVKKIISKNIKLSVTCVRVPVFVSHSLSVNVEFDNELSAKEVEEILRESDGISVNSIGNEVKYTTPIDATGNDEVFVSRIRDDLSLKNAINLWICTDNLRKGAALNAVQIAETLIEG